MREIFYAFLFVIVVILACASPFYGYYGPGFMPVYHSSVVVVRPAFVPRPLVVVRPSYGRRW